MFDKLIGNQRVKELLKRMIAQGRLPGALLFTGQEGIGKKKFALEVARNLNCRSLIDGEACGKCGPCTRISKINFPAESEAEQWIQIIWTDHPDVGIVVAPKRLLRVEQMRQIEREANFRPFEGQARIFIVDDADKLNDASANALLKILEEPPPTSLLILITARPAMLLPTIRSRCQMIRFSPLTAEELESYLVKNHLSDKAAARLRAHTADGSLRRALSGDLASFTKHRQGMLAVLNAIVVKDDHAALLRSAEELNEAQYKEEFEARLDVLETLVRDIWMLALGVEPSHLVNEDLLEQIQTIANKLRPARAADWILQIEDMREQLVVNINRKAATDALFMTMATS